MKRKMGVEGRPNAFNPGNSMDILYGRIKTVFIYGRLFQELNIYLVAPFIPMADLKTSLVKHQKRRTTLM